MKIKKVRPRGVTHPCPSPPYLGPITKNTNTCNTFLSPHVHLFRLHQMAPQVRIIKKRLPVVPPMIAVTGSDPTKDSKFNLTENVQGKSQFLNIYCYSIIKDTKVKMKETLPGLGHWNWSQFTFGMLAHFGVIREPLDTK